MEILTSRPPEMSQEQYRATLKLQQQALKQKKLGEFVFVSSELVFDTVGKVSGIRKAKTPFKGPVFKTDL